ncbi:receptor-like serine/threonine-protein kinase SD1-8 [Cryptomeria japonica]|uniref:receptor-like serine/threonine-protein kinase SD1-8 n=1 Tax=Cryptomeria japonica TaxID=3369 RepID=UPI0027DA0905|nr:receptor-like serine/threonine-protein kinase SD1-8 [Cryptomeria japonica]
MNMWNGMKLTSWKSSVDPGSGLFSYGMDISSRKTQLVMTYNNSVPYWSSGEWTGSYFTNIPEGKNATKILETSCVSVSPSRLYCQFRVIPTGYIPTGHILTGRTLLNENGELKVYLWMDDGTWTEVWSTYRGQCSDYEICGAYGPCNASDVCSCIEGFSPKNDSQGWWSSGCARRRSLQCSVTTGTTDGFLETKNRYLPEEEAVSYNNEPTMEGCRTDCLNNCSCTAFAFVFYDPPTCRLWFGDLFKMRVSSDNQSIFIRLAASELPHSTLERSSKAPLLLILLPSVTAFFVVLAALLAAFILWKRRRLQKKSVEEDEDVPIMLKMFTYKEL